MKKDESVRLKKAETNAFDNRPVRYKMSLEEDVLDEDCLVDDYESENTKNNITVQAS